MQRRFGKRTQTGSALTEFGPALLLLLIMLFFPLVDMLSLGVVYAATLSLNDIQAREAANISSTQAPSMMDSVTSSWMHTGMGAFVQLKNKPDTKLNYLSGETDSTGTTDKYVEVTTTVTARPFVTLPFFPIVPGLTAPLSYKVTTRRMLENPHYA